MAEADPEAVLIAGAYAMAGVLGPRRVPYAAVDLDRLAWANLGRLGWA